MQNIFVLKVGGSTLSLSDELLFNFEEANRLKEVLMPFIQQGYKFALITGGGFIARKYQKILKDQGYPEYDQHYIGTLGCNLNAIMLRAVFGGDAEEKILALDEIVKEDPITLNKPFQLAGGGPVGVSSDWDAVQLAKRIGAKFVVSMKDIGGVYSTDPDKDPTAVLVPKLNWDEYLKIIGNPEEQTPGANFPVDPEAAQHAKENGIGFYITSGKELSNLNRILKGETFTGSAIN